MQNTELLDKLLADSGLAAHATRIEPTLARLQYGSAFVLVGVSGSAIVAIAPLFKALPQTNELAFCKKLLEHNAFMGGIASFALQKDGWVVLQSGRAIKGLDASEFANLVAGVGKYADDFDDPLIAEFYPTDRDATNQAKDTELDLPAV